MFAYGIECSVSNAYVLDKFAKPIEHAHSGRSKRDYFAFRYELANHAGADLGGGPRGPGPPPPNGHTHSIMHAHTYWHSMQVVTQIVTLTAQLNAVLIWPACRCDL